MVQYSASSHWFWHYYNELQHHWYQLTPPPHYHDMLPVSMF